MSWDNDEVMKIVERLGKEAALWLLAMSRVRGVGTNRARNYTVFPGKIKSISKELGLDPIQEDRIKDGFDRLKRIQFESHGGGFDTVILGDKPEYVKLTDHGLTLVTLIDSDEELQQQVREFIGAETDEEDAWWPRNYDKESAEIMLKAVSEEPEDYSNISTIEVVAKFDCSVCNETIESDPYELEYYDQAWSKTNVTTCSCCGMKFEYSAGHPFGEITPLDT
ncbi:hypothetical protein [Haloferax sp. Atlit-6N]|uniref:hypothetical protein n=1 Tax=Haloferax sp. Atlit-6N TaxID=2077205 RepID=UPI0011C03F9D|nr:hypothetical protein [Haloferax sp. Atlit-6N]